MTLVIDLDLSRWNQGALAVAFFVKGKLDDPELVVSRPGRCPAPQFGRLDRAMFDGLPESDLARFREMLTQMQTNLLHFES